MSTIFAARWPDDIRGDPTWDHPTWHYINVPLTRDGVSGSPPTAPNILTALDEAAEVSGSNISGMPRGKVPWGAGGP